MNLHVKAQVRKAGAIGIFYEAPFIVKEAEGLARRHVLNAWQAQHGDNWELHHLIGWLPLPEELVIGK